jgi:hypothetical protein
MMGKLEYNYAKFIDKSGDVNGVAQMEVGSDNEVAIVNWCIDNEMTLVKITKEEFDNFEGDFDIELE